MKDAEFKSSAEMKEIKGGGKITTVTTSSRSIILVRRPGCHGNLI